MELQPAREIDEGKVGSKKRLLGIQMREPIEVVGERYRHRNAGSGDG